MNATLPASGLTRPPGPGDALLLVDLQQDFLPGGALAVPHGEEVVGLSQGLVDLFVARGLPVCASRDWHPAGHLSFRPRGGPWPVHAVAGSEGADFSTDLELPGAACIVSKGTEADREAYSAFEGTSLHGTLQSLGVRRLFVAGLATDYCVRATVLQARERGYEVVVLQDAVRAVEARAGDGARALQEMAAAGAVLGSCALIGVSPALSRVSSASIPAASARSLAETSTG